MLISLLDDIGSSKTIGVSFLGLSSMSMCRMFGLSNSKAELDIADTDPSRLFGVVMVNTDSDSDMREVRDECRLMDPGRLMCSGPKDERWLIIGVESRKSDSE